MSLPATDGLAVRPKNISQSQHVFDHLPASSNMDTNHSGKPPQWESIRETVASEVVSAHKRCEAGLVERVLKALEDKLVTLERVIVERIYCEIDKKLAAADRKKRFDATHVPPLNLSTITDVDGFSDSKDLQSLIKAAEIRLAQCELKLSLMDRRIDLMENDTIDGEGQADCADFATMQLANPCFDFLQGPQPRAMSRTSEEATPRSNKLLAMPKNIHQGQDLVNAAARSVRGASKTMTPTIKNIHAYPQLLMNIQMVRPHAALGDGVCQENARRSYPHSIQTLDTWLLNTTTDELLQALDKELVSL